NAITLRPGFEGAAVALISTLTGAIELDAAVGEGQALLEQMPASAELRFTLMTALMQSGRSGQALELIKQGLDAAPGHPLLTEGLVNAQQYVSGIPDVDRTAHARSLGVVMEQKGLASAGAPPPWMQAFDPNRTLRIGYISPDLREHSVAYFFSP